jgi:membrane associated rhomboid family serine protease
MTYLLGVSPFSVGASGAICGIVGADCYYRMSKGQTGGNSFIILLLFFKPLFSHLQSF